MVGVPRSKGCALCVQRRVKCDQVKPQCGNCVRYKASCPGYDKTLKFVTGKHQVKPRKSPTSSQASGKTSQAPSRASGSSSASPTFTSHTTSSASPIPELAPDYPVAQYGLIVSPNLPRGQFISSMLSNMYTKVTPGEGWFLNSWFTGIETKLGEQTTLDSAAMSLCLHVLGKANNDEGLIGDSRHLYGKSLQSLQRALNHKSEWKSTETLCATTMLCYFELFAGTKDAGSWMQHASGVAWLIQQRGPDAYMTEWDKAILKTFRAMITMDALFSGKDCFLAKPEWQACLRRLINEQDVRTLEEERRASTDQYFMLLAKVPTVFKYTMPIHNERMSGLWLPVDYEGLAPIMKYAKHILKDFQAWSKDLYRLFEPPVDVPSKDSNSPFPLVHEFENVWEGSLYMGYWATTVILQYSIMIGDEASTGIYVKNNRELCSKIYRSIEQVGAGLMGPYRVGYSLRIAYEPAEPHVQRWIKELLEKYGRIYAGLSTETFPDPEDRMPNVWEPGFVDETIPPGLS